MPYRFFKLDYVQAFLISAFSALAAYMNSTFTFLCALLLAFLFNILAGFRADEVKLEIKRIFPPIIFKNFQGNKFKDSLFELFLIVGITYFLKGIADLMKYQNQSGYIVQFLTAIAIYYYFRNALKNLHKVYPKNQFISMLYYLVAFKFRQLIGANLADIVDKGEKTDNIKLD